MARKIEVQILGDASSLQRAFGKSALAAEGFGSKMGKVAKIAVLAAGTAGIGAIAFGLKKSIDSANDHAKAMAITEAGIKSTGGAAKVTAKQIGDFSNALEKKTGIDDLAIQSGQNMLLTFTKVRNEVGKGNDIFNQASRTLVDLATRMGNGTATTESMSKSAIQLGKALNDPITGMGALRRVGVTFDEGQKKTIKTMVESGNVMGAQKIILKELNKEFGGTAAAVGQTLPGQLNILKARLDDVAQRIGEKLIPVLERMVSWVSDHMPEISAVVEKVANAIGTAIRFAADMVGRGVDLIRQHWDTIKSDAMTVGAGAFNAVKTAAETFVSFIRSDWGQSMLIGAGAMLGFVKAISGIKAAVQIAKLALASLSTNPFFLGLAGISLALGFVAQNFLSNAMAADVFSGAIGRAKQALDDLKGSLDANKDAHLALDRAKITLQQSTAALSTEEGRWRATLRSSTATEAEKRDAYLRLIDAKQRVKESTQGLTEAEKRAADADRTRVAQLQAGLPTLESLRDKVAKVSTELEKHRVTSGLSGAAAQKMATEFQKVVGPAAATARALAEQDPTASRAAAKTSLYAGTVATLATKLNAVPKKTVIEAALKKVNFEAFYADLLKAGPKAKSSAAAAVRGLDEGLKPMKSKAINQVGQAIAAVAGKAGALRGAGRQVGVAGGDGLAKGLFSMMGAVRAAAAAISSAAAVSMHVAVKSASASKVTFQLGKWMGEGLVLGMGAVAAAVISAGSSLAGGLVEAIRKNLVAGGAKLKDATKQAINTAVQVAPSIEAAGRVLGLAHARGIALGVLQGSPSIAQQMRTALREAVRQAIADATQKVTDSRAAFATAFGTFADAATAAFNAKFAAWKSPSQMLLDKLALAKTLTDIGNTLGPAAEELMTKIGAALAAGNPKLAGALEKQLNATITAALANATTTLADAKTALAAAQAGGDPDAIAKAQDAVTAAQTNLDAITTAQQTALTLLATQETAAHDKKVIADNLRFAKDLASLNKALLDQTTSVQEKHRRLLKFLSDEGLGGRVAAELRGKLKEVENAADDLAAAIKNRLNLTATVTVVVNTASPGANVGKAAKGAFLSGSKGSPQLVLAHAGEMILNPDQQRKMGGASYLANLLNLPRFDKGGFVGPPLFTAEGPQFYKAAYKHNSPFAKGNPFQTSLDWLHEWLFQSWVKLQNIPFSLTDAISDYDMRGFFKDVMKYNPLQPYSGHFPDTYKTPYDTTFSGESEYATADNPFKWVGDMLADMRNLLGYHQIVFRALGGGVGSGRPYIVGEKGPELFVPQGNGRIVPNNQLTASNAGGAGGVHVHFHGGTFIGSNPDQVAKELAPAIRSHLGRTQHRNFATAF